MRGKTLTYVLLITVPAQALWLLDDLDLAQKLGLEAVVVAIVAVVVAIQHANELESVADELRSVARSVPTRGIGVFPSYVSDVADLVGRAKESITILCDTPAHGAFSNTVAFTNYWTALRHRMVDGVEVKCAFFDAPGREQLHQAQFKADSGSWDAWKERNSANCEAFDQLARKLEVESPLPAAGGPVAAWAGTPDAFVKSMMAINKAVLSRFDNGLKIEELSFSDPLHQGPSVYFWLRDGDQEAVFVIVPVRGIGVRDLAGFHTKEPELIRALGTVFEHRKEKR